MRPTGPNPTGPDVPPTRPARPRRPMLPLAAAGGAFVLAAVGGGVGYLLVSDDKAEKPEPRHSASAAAGGNVFAADWPDITTLPDACATISPATLGQVVPGAEAERLDSGSGGGYDLNRHCSWSRSDGGRSRSMDVTLNLRRSEGALNGAKNIATTLAGWWRQYEAETRSTADPDTKAITAKRVPGIGSEAFYQYKLTGGKLGESGVIRVEARVRNVAVRLAYQGYDNPSGDPLDYDGQRGLDEATATRDALRAVREIVPHMAAAARNPAPSAPAQPAPTSPAVPPAAGPRTVVYEVTGADKASVNYSDENLRRADAGEVALPWRKTIRLGEGKDAAFLLAINFSGDAPVTCRILVDGKEVSKKSGRTVTCSLIG